MVADFERDSAARRDLELCGILRRGLRELRAVQVVTDTDFMPHEMVGTNKIGEDMITVQWRLKGFSVSI